MQAPGDLGMREEEKEAPEGREGARREARGGEGKRKRRRARGKRQGKGKALVMALDRGPEQSCRGIPVCYLLCYLLRSLLIRAPKIADSSLLERV